MTILNEKQQEILEVIRTNIENQGYAPTVRDIGALVGLSSSCSVKKHLDTLELKGFIRRDRYKRNIELMENGEPVRPARTIGVPLFGRAAGGRPLFVDADAPAEEILPIPLSLLPRGSENSRDLFAVTVHGDSMRDVGIMNGDIVVARRQSSARDGEIVIALIEDEATVKTFYREANRIRLQPENPDYEPIYPEDVTIQGKVTLAIKQF